MAQQILNNGISGQAFRGILNQNFTELYNDKAPKNHSSTSDEFGVTSTTNFGHVKVTIGNGLNVSGGVLSLQGATTNDAIVGTSTSMVMTPARVKEAVNGYGVMSDGNLIIKVGDTQPTPQTGKTILWVDTSS